jgi:thioester reductase-like protein
MTGPRSVLVTGGTGFLGAHLVAELLDRGHQVRCLVRAPDQQAGRARLVDALDSFRLGERDAVRDVDGPLSAVVGDLGRPLLGLTAERFGALAEEVDLIVHSGAWVNMAYPYEVLKPVNVDGTREVLRLAAVRRTPVQHISSLAVLGEPPKDTPVPESLHAPKAELGSGYARSKWVADRLVAVAGERGLPVAVHRIGWIFAHRETGAFNAADLVVRLLFGVLALRAAPVIDAELRLAPVDWVARTVVSVAEAPHRANRAYHLAGPSGTGWQQLVVALSELVGPLAVLPYPAWRRSVFDAAAAGAPDMVELAALLPEEAPLADYALPIAMDHVHAAGVPVLEPRKPAALREWLRLLLAAADHV